MPTFEEAGTAKQTIDKLKAQEGPLSAEQQKELDGAESAFARKTEDNILNQQAGIEKRGGKLHPTTAKALEAARATLARPRPEGNTDIVGTPDKTTSSTASSSSPLPPADTATTQGVTPPAGTSTDTRTSTANADGTTVTASSADSTSPGGSTHTTSGIAPPPVGHGNRIPEVTTHPEHIDLATRRVENLGKIAAKRKLNPHEQGIYDNALRVRDRNAPAQPGDRNNPLPQGRRDTANPQDLVMAGGGVPITKTQSAAADALPPAAPGKPANAIGSTINGPGTTNPDAPRSSTKNGSGNTGPPSSPQQQQQVAPQGSGPANTAINGNGQPPSAPSPSSQTSDLPSLPQSGPSSAHTHRFDSPPEHADPRLKEAFKNWPYGWDEQGFPNSPKTLPEGHELLQPTHKKDTAILPKENLLVHEGFLPADTPVPRAALHAAIIDYFMHKAEPLPAGIRPTIYVSGGGGGAGKSTILEHLHNRGALNTTVPWISTQTQSRNSFQNTPPS